MTYGYDSNATHWLGQATTQGTITERADGLLAAVAMERLTCQGRPLIFIAHSLGGILAEKAINTALQKEEAWQGDPGTCAKHIFFFGTPHEGSKHAAFADKLIAIAGTLGLDTNRKIVQGLQRDSEILRNIDVEFQRLLDKHTLEAKTKVCTFLEGWAMVGVKGLNTKISSPLLILGPMAHR